MLGGLGNLAGMMKQAKEMQSRMKEMQEVLANARYEGDSGAGAVKATVTGKMELVGLKIDPGTVASGDVEMLEDLVKAAVGAAQSKAAEGAKQEVQKMTGGMNLPGLDGLLGGGGQ
ncbi:MAG: YbaB/EbfC family nucleoid-associated protein [Phycisphaerae bacterium]|nr:YbaB/EbfC family nucleoid-associated protein [Phycisphaerae bacterium]